MLRQVQHPCVARLVASFKYKEGAFLVAELASRGDLHTHVVRLGAVSVAAARFIAGELVCSLAAVHALGFAFGDLKPENVLLTGAGHAKLTDFGAVRPCCLEGEALLEAAGDVFGSLRDGGWREELVPRGLGEGGGLVPQALREAADGSKIENVDALHGDAGRNSAPTDTVSAVGHQDDRLEGTAAYMAPELARGGRPNPASDAWALGCLVYFMLAGRPPMWADSDTAVLDRVVRFNTRDMDELFPDDFPPDARDLVSSLLVRNPARRLGGGEGAGMREIAMHHFFHPLRSADGDAH